MTNFWFFKSNEVFGELFDFWDGQNFIFIHSLFSYIIFAFWHVSNISFHQLFSHKHYLLTQKTEKLRVNFSFMIFIFILKLHTQIQTKESSQNVVKLSRFSLSEKASILPKIAEFFCASMSLETLRARDRQFSLKLSLFLHGKYWKYFLGLEIVRDLELYWSFCYPQ